MLPMQYCVIQDEAYPCLAQEMPPWKGWKLSIENGALIIIYHCALSGLVVRPQALCPEGMGLIPIQVARVFVGVSTLNPLVWVAF